jgi:Putative metallopeptidase
LKNVLAAADAFHIESKQQTTTSRNLADEHLLQEQRFYNSLCMIYGSDSAKYQYFVSDGYLPKERAVRCPGEYQKTVESWKNLLQPWRKDK